MLITLFALRVDFFKNLPYTLRIESERNKIMKDNKKMNKLQFKNEVLALVSEDALPMVDALTEQGFAEGWTPAEVAGQCEADA